MNIVQETVKFLDGPFKEPLAENQKFLQKNEHAYELYSYIGEDEKLQKPLYMKLQKMMSDGKYDHGDAVTEWSKVVMKAIKSNADFNKSWFKAKPVVNGVARILADECKDDLKALEKSGKSASTMF